MEFVEVKTEYYLAFEKFKTNKISRVDSVLGAAIVSQCKQQNLSETLVNEDLYVGVEIYLYF